MATRKRRTANRVRRAPVKRTASRRNRSTLKVTINSAVAREIAAVFYLALGVLTILSLQGGVGIVGEFWISFLQPILGWGIYIIPVLFITASLMLFFSKKITFGFERILGMSLLLISVLSILHLSVPIGDIFNVAEEGTYGGYTGFVTNFLLLEVLSIGYLGAGVIFLALFLVSLLLTFEVSLKDLIAFITPKIKLELSNPKKEKTEKRVPHKSIDDLLDEMTDDQAHRGIKILNSQIGKAKVTQDDEEEDTDDDEDEVSEFNPQINLQQGLKNDSTQGALTSSNSDEDELYWETPSLDLLESPVQSAAINEQLLRENAAKIRDKLQQFGIDVTMHEIHVGPTVVQYTLKPSEGVKLSKITSLKNDLALALAAKAIRIEAPIPGKSLVGIELPNDSRSLVFLREIIETTEFTEGTSGLKLPLGRDVSGRPMVGDLETMPHLLIAGATGSGKSVGMNTFLMSLIYQNSPKNLRMIMIDPKRVELKPYNGIPHLLAPVITDPEKAAISLRWLVAEMMRRYQLLSDTGVRNIAEYNSSDKVDDQMPRIVVVVDELADLMMAAGKEVEASICRLAQMARAVGIHLIIATQRPSVDVITGLIKANVPARIAFAVSSGIDSRVILDTVGAEDLLGRGDMLYLPGGMSKPVRVQGIYVDTKEVERVMNFVKLHSSEPDYNQAITSPQMAIQDVMGVPESETSDAKSSDKLYEQALQIVREHRKASASLLQRRLKVGYARAARLIDLLEENGVVGPAKGAKPREIYLD